jgi:hypothetical protein
MRPRNQPFQRQSTRSILTPVTWILRNCGSHWRCRPWNDWNITTRCGFRSLNFAGQGANIKESLATMTLTLNLPRRMSGEGEIRS